MSLKKSKGNMYSWLTHVHSFLGGSCVHDCRYCYIKSAIYRRNPKFIERYTGDISLIEKEFNTNYGEGKTIFIEHMNDLFAENIPNEFIVRILEHCKKFPKNTYVFQTKNPARYNEFIHLIPADSILGTTIETNRDMSDISKAPPAKDRYKAMKKLKFRKFVTTEPALKFDIKILAKWIGEINPEFFNIGADSKGNNLIEPTYSEILELTNTLRDKYGIEVREKHNMQRLIDKEKEEAEKTSSVNRKTILDIIYKEDHHMRKKNEKSN